MYSHWLWSEFCHKTFKNDSPDRSYTANNVLRFTKKYMPSSYWIRKTGSIIHQQPHNEQ